MSSSTSSPAPGRYRCVVAERSTIDIGVWMDEGTQLGHASALYTSQRVPEEQSWHGSPARPSTLDYQSVDLIRCGTSRRVLFSALQLLSLLGVVAPLAITAADTVIKFLNLGSLTLTGRISV